MNLIKKGSHIHLLGICGTAMATVAFMLKKGGYEVSGSDDVFYPPMSDFLKEHSIQTFTGYKRKNLSRRPDLVVVGNSISRGNTELEFVLNEKIAYISMPELIRFAFLTGKSSIVITGTHGKTTTTTLVAYMLSFCEKQPSYLIGGRPLNLPASGDFTKGEHFVIEGDEYDSAYFDKRSKFLHYYPDYLIINNLEFDHADIFENLDAIKLSFSRLLKLVPAKGLVLYNGDDKNLRSLVNDQYSRFESFGTKKHCDWQMVSFRQDAKGISFEVFYRNKKIVELQASLFGEFNAMNIMAAFALGYHLKISKTKLKKAFANFKGVQRRLNLLYQEKNISIYDDFAHHPTAIEKTITAIRSLHKNARIIAAFEPRSNTSVRKFFVERWPKAFSRADLVYFAPLHRMQQIAPADRLPLKDIVKTLQKQGKKAEASTSFETLFTSIKRELKAGDVVLFMSNGAFAGIPQRLVKELK